MTANKFFHTVQSINGFNILNSLLKSYTVIFILLVNFYTQPKSAALDESNVEIQFTHLTAEDGLSVSAVTRIIQDRRGFLWFGTYNGLNRYDGYNYKIFLPEPNNPFSISNHSIAVLYEDTKGNIWIGTFDGLNRYDWKTEKFYKYKNSPKDPHSISNNNIYTIFEDKSGNIWIGTLNGLNKYNRDNDNFTVYKKVTRVLNPDSLNTVVCIEEDYKGNLWLGTWNGLTNMQKDGKVINQFFAEPLTSKSFDYRKVRTIFEDNSNNLWIGTERKGLKKYNQMTGKFKDYYFVDSDPNTISHNYISTIFQDKSNHIWIGTKKGLNLYNPKAENFTRIIHDPLKPLSIINNEIYCIAEDNTGNIWIGTSGGISMFHLPINKFGYYLENKTDIHRSLSSSRVNSMTIDKNENIWIGTFEGLDKIEKGNDKIIHYNHVPGNPNSLSNNYIISVKEDHLGYLWIGTQDDGLNRYDPATGKYKLYSYDITDKHSISNKGITSICEDHNGTMWFGTWFGLNRFDRKTEKFHRYLTVPSDPNTLRNDLIWVVYEDSQNMIWIGTDGGGVSRLDPKTNSFIHFTRDTTNQNHISGNRVFSIFESSDKLLWFGTSDGLDSYDRKTGKIKIFNKNNGLLGTLISSIQEDDNGFLWIGSDKGLARYNRKTGIFTNFTKRDGLRELEFQSNGCAKSKDGILYFGCKNSLLYFDPAKIEDEKLDAPVVFTDLKIYNQPVLISENGILKESLLNSRIINIPPGNDVLTIEFALLDYFDPKRNTFQYKLLGFDAAWNEVATRNSATYTNLPPGEYTFMVKATNDNGAINAREASLKLIIVPVFYQTWWFKIIFVFAAIFWIIVFYQIRTRSIKSRNKILEKRVAERTIDLDKTIKELNMEIASKDKFFSIIAHDLRSPFTGFLGLSEYLAEGIEDLSKDDLRTIARNMLKSAKVTYNLLENLLQWAGIKIGRVTFEPEEINLKRIITETVEIFKDIAENKNICVKVDVDDYSYAYADKNMVKTIIRNLFSNSLKFTEKQGEVSISVKDEDNFVRINIIDTGIGISNTKIKKLFLLDQNVSTLGTEDEKGSGLGLILCKEFVDRNRGQISVTSELDKGSKFSFTLPKTKI